MKRDLPERLRERPALPVEHVISDVIGEGLPFDVTLVAANVTVASDELHARLKAAGRREPAPLHRRRAAGARARATPSAEARERLAALLKSLRGEGIVAAGMIGDPDPYTAIMNAVDYFYISEIVISTLPEASSKWVADKLVDRVQSASNKPVEHIESGRRRERRPDGSRTPSHGTSTTGRPRPTAPRGWTPGRSGCCFSSSPR